MDERIRRTVRDRAGDRCEYCRLSQSFDALPFQVDHVIAQVHHGASSLANLAWSCFDCNVYKGPNLAGIDPETGRITPLYHPRNEKWDEHFRWAGAAVIGTTPQGRATIDVLRINLPSRVEHRRLLAAQEP
jgi:5-methylcytosine-specific restriction endonuclease McrA